MALSFHRNHEFITEVTTIDIQDNPIVGNDPKTIGPKLSTIGNGVQSAPSIIGTKLSTRENEVQEVFHQMLVGAMWDSLLNLRTRVSYNIACPNHGYGCECQKYWTACPRTKCKFYWGEKYQTKATWWWCHTSPLKRNATICGHLGTLAKKQHDSIICKKKKKRCDENFDAVAKLVAYASQKNRVISTRNTPIKDQQKQI